MRVRDMPLQELSTFELLAKLESAGFRCIVHDNKKDSARIKTLVYNADDEDKVWYLRRDGHVDRLYLISLLTGVSLPRHIPAIAGEPSIAACLACRRRRRRLGSARIGQSSVMSCGMMMSQPQLPGDLDGREV